MCIIGSCKPVEAREFRILFFSLSIFHDKYSVTKLFVVACLSFRNLDFGASLKGPCTHC